MSSIYVALLQPACRFLLWLRAFCPGSRRSACAGLAAIVLFYVAALPRSSRTLASVSHILYMKLLADDVRLRAMSAITAISLHQLCQFLFIQVFHNFADILGVFPRRDQNGV